MLQEFPAEEQEFFEDPGNDSLLNCLQQDILSMRENSAASLKAAHLIRQIRYGDSSIAFHSCHSPMREVEILHDQLLALFDEENNDDAIEPRDVLVMAPEIDTYAPLIRAVFDADISISPKIPYSVSDQSIRKTSKYIETFLNILLLPLSRFSSIDLMGLLEAEPVRDRFNIADADLAVIEHWIREK
ncbi:MAG: exodeoxyribonuclease V subunit gamma, partial [Gammaproteobacteria bacterium]|nr:exodeoxyribonuclease V subunit gamma [Gammaproteobacteria bacterium]NIR95771.1 exodeoxyribonuclease V subunit gamma [Gammaproteobacteria bacterium]NIW48351.1 exodeoxyribonuclease V subunit gamma [Gammaproteobacteria bacterium]